MWFLCLFSVMWSGTSAYLYPLESESRQVKNLNGMWNFNKGECGFDLKWYQQNLKHTENHDQIPVPCSYNEVLSDPSLRDYLGWVWYQREFYLSKKWSGSEETSGSHIFIYFGAVDHHAVVWCNGIEVGRHSGGHIPFHLELTEAIKWNQNNFITVAVNNTLTPTTLPQGYTKYQNNTYYYPPGTFLYTHNCDYFDYVGINRNVFLYSVPEFYIKNFEYTVNTHDNRDYLTYNITMENNIEEYANCTVRLIDPMGNDIILVSGCKKDSVLLAHDGNNKVKWNIYDGILIDCIVTMEYGFVKDVYRTNIGLRSLSWEDSKGLQINGKNFYIKGFGMHEDSDIRGRGYDDVIATKDINLLRWTGANTIRTSHYPYSEEFLRMCDINGIAVILEVPACSLERFDDALYDEHERLMIEIIQNYKHHPSIIMWTLANEPLTKDNASVLYFKNLYDSAKSVDPTRPITFVTSQQIQNEKAIGNMDAILINRYSGWYQVGGRLDLIQYQLKKEITSWRSKYNKPVIITEYGAGSLPGQHSLLPFMWTEDYQEALLHQHFKVYDDLRKNGSLSGEMIWNLIDFKTPQEYFRPGFCMKGVFTRQREPKSVAKLVKERYTSK